MPWFTRLWVFQEVAFAKDITVLCGEQSIPWWRLAQAVMHLHHKGVFLECEDLGTAGTGVKAVAEMEKVRQKARECDMPRDLISVLLATSDTRCTDPRDKVYAVLGLVDDDACARLETPIQVEVDYDADAGQVYQRLAQKFIAARDLRILSCASQRGGTFLDESISIPSWVPDWTAIENDAPFIRYNMHTMFPQAQYLSSGQQPEIRSSNVLELPCVEIDQVEAIVPATTFTKTPLVKRYRSLNDQVAMTKNAEWLKSCCQLVAQGKTMEQQQHPCQVEEGISDEASYDPLWFVLAAGLSGNARPIEAYHESYFARYVAFINKIVGNPYEPRIVINDKNGVIAEVEAAVYLWSSKRLFGITKGGRAVLVPMGTRKGDQIILPAFSVVPLVVRHRGGGGEPCQGMLLGEAFVRDVMSGEYVEEFQKTHRRMEDAANYAVWKIS
ncbi:hypothetical protein PG984_003093 [Apiospora sp. TS-2023a]